MSEVLPELSIEQTETVRNVISNMSILNGLYIEHLWFTEQKQTGSGQPTNVPVYVKELQKWLSEAYERVRQHLSAEQKRHKLLYDTKVAGNPFVKGDKVWLHNAAVPRGYSKKLHRFWKGSYTVVDVLDNCVYKIKQDASPH